MFVSQRPFEPLSRLNAKEQEILGLLTAGHTVKSIAAQLDRSEASINERLREARRKTGVGSSRELARLLDAQINRDRKSDLAGTPGSVDSSAQRSTAGRIKPKGPILMTISAILAAAALSLAPGETSPGIDAQADRAVATAPSPLLGRWALDVARIPAEERPRSVTISFAAAANGQWTTRVEIVAPDGSRRTAESTASPNGSPVPITGTMGFIDTAALRQPQPGTLVMTLSKDGKPVSTRVYTVSGNGRAMTETIIWAAGGTPALPTTYFNRID